MKGIDLVEHWQPHVQRKRRYLKALRDEDHFLRIKLVLQQFTDKTVPMGSSSYAFSF